MRREELSFTASGRSDRTADRSWCSILCTQFTWYVAGR